MGFFENQVIISSPIDGIKTYIIPTKAKDVITFSGSFSGGSKHISNINPKISTITASMIDKGTTNKDKYDISPRIESYFKERLELRNFHINYIIKKSKRIAQVNK